MTEHPQLTWAAGRPNSVRQTQSIHRQTSHKNPHARMSNAKTPFIVSRIPPSPCHPLSLLLRVLRELRGFTPAVISKMTSHLCAHISPPIRPRQKIIPPLSSVPANTYQFFLQRVCAQTWSSTPFIDAGPRVHCQLATDHTRSPHELHSQISPRRLRVLRPSAFPNPVVPPCRRGSIPPLAKNLRIFLP